MVSAALASGADGPPDVGVTSLRPASFADLRRDLLRRRASLDLFRPRGPYAVVTREDFVIDLSSNERIDTDLFLSDHGEKTPLVIIMHGFGSSKTDHTYQALHLASWGMHTLVVELPNKGPWVNNGKTLAKIVRLLYGAPKIIDNRFDNKKIVLIGHSFGGVAVSVALAEGAPANGGILLDPAAISRQLPGYLSRIRKPVLIIGADERLSPVRNRDYFYRYVRNGVAEVSIKGAIHEDAQFPVDSDDVTEELQIAFTTAMTSAAFSLSSTGKFDYAWAGFGAALKSSKFFNPKRK